MALNKNIKWQEAKRFWPALVIGQLVQNEANESQLVDKKLTNCQRGQRRMEKRGVVQEAKISYR